MTMKTTLLIVALWAAVSSVGCLRAGPPKTPNQLEVEQEERDGRNGATHGADALPPAIKR